MRILIIGALPQSLEIFRGPLLRAMVARGHQVWACAHGEDQHISDFCASIDVCYQPISIHRAGLNPWRDFQTVRQLSAIIKSIKADIVFSYTIKPVIYGGIAARLCSVPAIYSMISGLGHAFIPVDSLQHLAVRKIAQSLYRFSLGFSAKVFFQNPDDIDDFLAMGLVDHGKIRQINGTGVDLAHYAVAPLPQRCVFIMIARLLGEKGVREYIEAARILKARYPDAEWLLVGDADLNPDSLSASEIERLKQNGTVRYLGYCPDIRPAMTMASVCVLPSYYREGIPRTIQEAMAMGRAVIVTNAPGCRETVRLLPGEVLDKNSPSVITGENGFLVPVKNVEKLCQAMERCLTDSSLRAAMGAASRRYAEERFDVHKVNEVLLAEMGL